MLLTPKHAVYPNCHVCVLNRWARSHDSWQNTAQLWIVANNDHHHHSLSFSCLAHERVEVADKIKCAGITSNAFSLADFPIRFPWSITAIVSILKLLFCQTVMSAKWHQNHTPQSPYWVSLPMTWKLGWAKIQRDCPAAWQNTRAQMIHVLHVCDATAMSKPKR